MVSGVTGVPWVLGFLPEPNLQASYFAHTRAADKSVRPNRIQYTTKHKEEKAKFKCLYYMKFQKMDRKIKQLMVSVRLKLETCIAYKGHNNWRE